MATAVMTSAKIVMTNTTAVMVSAIAVMTDATAMMTNAKNVMTDATLGLLYKGLRAALDRRDSCHD